MLKRFGGKKMSILEPGTARRNAFPKQVTRILMGILIALAMFSFAGSGSTVVEGSAVIAQAAPPGGYVADFVSRAAFGVP